MTFKARLTGRFGRMGGKDGVNFEEVRLKEKASCESIEHIRRDGVEKGVV